MTNKNVFNGKLHARNPYDDLTKGLALQDIQGYSAWLNIFMCALAGLANCAKADNVSAQEHFDAAGNMRSIVVNNPTAQIGTVKTPWMFVRPDGKSGFANNFTTNAISVVSENGIEYYAHVEGENGDRTKVIKFTIDRNTGIPSTHGDIIDTTTLGEEGSVAKMANRKLVGVAGHGTLCFYPTEDYGTSLIYNPQLNAVFTDEIENLVGFVTQKHLASYQDEDAVYVLCNVKCENEGWTGTATYLKKIGTGDIEYSSMFPRPEKNGENRAITYRMAYRKDDFCIGDSEGNVDYFSDNGYFGSRIFQGPVSSITMPPNRVDVFVTSTATNAFCNIGLGTHAVYNAVSVNGSSSSGAKTVVPKTTDGLVRIIDNRHNNGGKLLCVTPKGIHAIDD